MNTDRYRHEQIEWNGRHPLFADLFVSAGAMGAALFLLTVLL